MPAVTVGWNVANVPGATGAELEVMAPAPTLYGAVNTVTNQNGSKRDDDGFNHPSTAVIALPGVKGSHTVNLASLGLPTSLQYPVRVLATRGGKPVGQASPSSFLQYLDGDQVAGTVESLSVTGGQALISADTFGGTTGVTLTDSATTRYNLATGTLGAALTDDTSGTSLAQNVGTDPGTGNTLILRSPVHQRRLPDRGHRAPRARPSRTPRCARSAGSTRATATWRAPPSTPSGTRPTPRSSTRSTG